MNRKTIFFALVSFLILASCKSHYEVASVQRSRILVDARYDATPDAEAAKFLEPYKHVVDSVMGPIVGQSARNMTTQRPEGTLPNLLADILVRAGKNYQEKPDFGVYNMGGVRADLPKGNVTYGDVLDVMAAVGGEGVSHEVRLVITKDGQLVSATLSGKPVDPQKDYRVATIDYLLGGNDKMEAFKKCRDINAPKDNNNNARFVIMDYFREMAKDGKEVDSQIEGRVIVK